MPHIGAPSGNRHKTSRPSGNGPVPWKVRVGLPRNIVRPVTSPQGWWTLVAGTRPGATVVVVVVVAVGAEVTAGSGSSTSLFIAGSP